MLNIMEAAAAMHWTYAFGGEKQRAAETENIKHRQRKFRTVKENRKLSLFKNNKPTYGSFPFLKAGVGKEIINKG